MMDTLGYVTAAETRQALRAVYREDPEISLQKVLLRALADDLKPLDDKARWRPNFLLILAGILVFALLSVFLYFSVGVRR